MKGLISTAVGLALVVGIVVGVIIGNAGAPVAQAQIPTDTPTPSATATATATPGPTATPTPAIGSGCYINWNSANCASGWTAVSTGEWTTVHATFGINVAGTAIICAAPKDSVATGELGFHSSSTNGESHLVSHEPCAICCGGVPAGSPSVIGGIAGAPAVAGPLDTSGMGGATYAVLAGAAAGALAFAVLGALAAKKRGVQQ